MRKPLTGTFLGVLMGVAVAVFLMRQGIWPLDQMTLFLMPAATGLLGLLMLSMGRDAESNTTLIISVLLLLPMLAWGALGIGEINQSGELNGGCEVLSASDVDETSVTDTSRRDPYEIDLDGGLIWGATSPTVFVDYEWEINANIGGIPVPLDSDTEDNEDASLVNGGEVEDVRAYAEARGINVILLTGVHEVGGFASTCDGFAFVRILGDGVDVVGWAALALAIILFIVLIALMVTRRRAVTTPRGNGTVVVDSDGTSRDRGRHLAGEDTEA